MENEVTKFDPKQLLNSVRDRIKAEFVGLIPDEEWHKLVEAEVDSFFEVRQTDSYGQRQWRDKQTSHFGEVVRTCLKEETQRRLKEYFDSEEFQSLWDGNNNTPGQGIKDMSTKIMADHLPALLEAMLAGKIQSVIQEIRNQSGY